MNNVFYEREVEKKIDSINNSFRVLAITGPRQVGKTAILKHKMPKNMTYVTLDDIDTKNFAINDPKLFIDTYKAPLFIDEVQYAPNLFSYIKIKVDNNNDRGQYWLSGSQVFNLMKGMSESLAGRVGIIEMNSFTYREINKIKSDSVFDPVNLKRRDKIDSSDVFELIFNGGMPELYREKNMNRNDFYSSYIDTYIEKDVKQIKDIGNVESFKKFMQEIAIRVGTILNYSDIAKDIGVDSKTIKSWVSILVTSGIIYLLPAYSSSRIDRLTKSPKIIFMDMGLCTYLAGWDSARSLELDKDSGRYLESYVVSEIIKQYNNLGKQLTIYHLRSKEKDEIDLIMFKNMTLYPIEIKKTGSVNKSMINIFSLLSKTKYKVGTGCLICLCDTLMPLDSTNYAVPISSVLNP